MSQTPFALEQDALFHYADREPDRGAVAFPLAQATLTFGQWKSRAGAFACALLARGLRPGDHVALLAESRVEWPVVEMAVALMGGVLVPLNTHYRIEDLRFALTQSGAKALVLSPSFRSNAYLEMVEALRAELKGIGLYVLLDRQHPGYEGFEAMVSAGAGASVELPRVDADAVAMLLYTSGTTGFPKGALVTHRALMQNAWVAGNRLDLGERDTLTTIIPLFHCAGVVGAILNALVHGARYVGVPWFDAESMFRIIQDERCTWLTGVPTSYLAMLQHPARAKYDLSSLRVGTCGGADCNPAVIEQCAKAFPMPGLVQVYGQTEATCFISLCRPGDAQKYATAGPPVEGSEARITDVETRVVLPAGSIGQVELRGPMIMIGYYERPKETAETLDAEGWMQTGDLGFLTPEGYIVLAGGRLKDMIIRGGENIYPVEVENVLATHADVAEIAVFGLPDAYYGEIVAAAVRTRAPVQPAALIAWGGERIARYKVPVKYFCTESFPMTSSGKIQKRKLRDLVLAGALQVL